MSLDLSKEALAIQQIVTKRRVVREELMNQIIELLKAMPAGYGKTVDAFRDEAIARIRSLVPEDE